MNLNSPPLHDCDIAPSTIGRRDCCIMATLACVAVLAIGCRDRSPVPPIPAPVVNLGDPKLKTVELSISEPSRCPSIIHTSKKSRFNVSWLGPVQPKPPGDPKPFLIKIGRKRSDGVFVETDSAFVLQDIKKEGNQARYRVAMNAPSTEGDYWLQLQTPGTVVLDIQLVIE